MKKNVSGQKVGAQLASATDGSDVTSGTTTVYVTLDAGTQATGTVGSGAATHEGNGYWTYAPSQAETNGDLVAFTFKNTSAVTATVQIYTSFPQTADAPTAAAVADAVWDEARSGHTTVGSFGEVSAPADIADAVWDEALSGHTTVGTAGKALTDAGSGANAATIADAVLDEALSGHTTAGTLGKAVADILDDTGTSGVAIADKTGFRLSATGVDDILDEAVEGAVTLRQAVRGFIAALLNKVSGMATTSVAFRDRADTKNRISATVDADGNRSAVTLDLT